MTAPEPAPEQSAARLPTFAPDELDPRQRELYDAIVGGRRATGPQLFALTDTEGGLNGPFNAMLLAPTLGHALQRLGAAIRYETTLSARMREMAILAVAARWSSDFERYAHEPIGRAAGVTGEELAAIRRSEVPVLPDDLERVAMLLVFALLRDEDVEDSTYDLAVATVGERVVYELTTLVGYYSMLALQLRIFRVPAPAES